MKDSASVEVYLSDRKKLSQLKPTFSHVSQVSQARANFEPCQPPKIQPKANCEPFQPPKSNQKPTVSHFSHPIPTQKPSLSQFTHPKAKLEPFKPPIIQL